MTNELSPANQHAGDIAPKALAFLGMARVIAESTMNAGTARTIPMAWRSRQIPLPARLMALADAFLCAQDDFERISRRFADEEATA